MIKHLKLIAAALGTLVFAASPLAAFAAFDDVSLTTDTVISVNSISLNISTDTATLESLTVNSETFSLTMATGSSITITSSNRNVMAIDSSALVTRDECSATASTLKLESNAISSPVTITPSSSTCSGAATSANAGGGSSGGSSGGGGGGGAKKEKTPAVAPTLPPTASPTAVAAVNAAFSRSLTIGNQGADVKQLQLLLNKSVETQITSSGPGSPGNETDLFGPLTKAAVGKFQMKYGIVTSSADPGFGFVGPKTRAKLMEMLGTAPSAPAAIPAANTGLVQQIANLLKQVQVLQAALDAMKKTTP